MGDDDGGGDGGGRIFPGHPGPIPNVHRDNIWYPLTPTIPKSNMFVILHPGAKLKYSFLSPFPC